MRAYRIVNWEATFEKSDLSKTLQWTWIAFPLKHDGKGYRRVTRLPNAVNVMLGFMMLAQVAAKCPQRGLLADADGPLEPQDLEDKTGFPARIFSEAIAALSDPETRIGWLEPVEFELRDGVHVGAVRGRPIVRDRYPVVLGVASPEPQTVSEPVRTHPDTSGPIRTRPNEAAPRRTLFNAEPEPDSQPEPEPAEPEYPVFPCQGTVKRWTLTDGHLRTLSIAFPSIDVHAECRAAWAWIMANPTNQKTGNGMMRFLTSWITRTINRTGANRNGNGNTNGNGRTRRSAAERGEYPEDIRCIEFGG
ncbi:MAG TPA: hypothetical protein VLH09_02575 [Bryobacteraceae bacterium]|nr:hypothetical protein [Bryobacteraceae bacterium]